MTSPDSVATTALVLAGGRGERLRPLTDDRPKPMIELAGAPILEHHLRWLREQGVERAVLLTGYLHEVVSSYFAEPRVEGLRVECVVEERPLGRGGAFRRGFEEAQISDRVVVATNGDVLTDQALAPMASAHARAGAAATILLTQMVSPYGIVDVGDDGLVRSFEEKPKLPHWINGGVYLLDASVFAGFPEEGDHETTTFPRLAAEGRLAAFKSEASWRSVDSMMDLREAEDYLTARQR
jgi:NDP-sugar pyrophosphorylase family protein